MSSKKFTVLSIVLGIGALFVFGILLFNSANNKAISLEEQILESESSINVQEKRRVDLIYNLVDTVKNYDKHENETLTKIAEMRSSNSEDLSAAQTAINAVTESYPELKSQENYKTLMTELAATENLIAEHRNNYNIQVKAYNKYVRKFPNKQLLSMGGYEVIDRKYLDFNAPVDAPTNLFGE